MHALQSIDKYNMYMYVYTCTSLQHVHVCTCTSLQHVHVHVCTCTSLQHVHVCTCTSFCCLTRVIIPLSHAHKSPPFSIFGDASSLVGIGLPFLGLALFFDAGAVSCPDAALTAGVCWGSAQAKEQRFLRIFVLGVGERSLHRSSS